MSSPPPEQAPNGRWRSNGRRAALGTLDAMLGEEPNVQLLRKSLQAEFTDDPVLFFKNIVMPLLPKTMLDTEAGDQTPEAKAEAMQKALRDLESATAAVELAGGAGSNA